ncbi:MAG: hypothetical protein HYW02_04200 [Deltaproteobacteria bacterium]|nr:hypothetical protein [Deltaproteobacteria bacterium]MBI2500664.1 hypothetical protein [Deltaproteobacteria bacterium]
MPLDRSEGIQASREAQAQQNLAELSQQNNDSLSRLFTAAKQISQGFKISGDAILTRAELTRLLNFKNSETNQMARQMLPPETTSSLQDQMRNVNPDQFVKLDPDQTSRLADAVRKTDVGKNFESAQMADRARQAQLNLAVRNGSQTEGRTLANNAATEAARWQQFQRGKTATPPAHLRPATPSSKTATKTDPKGTLPQTKQSLAPHKGTAIAHQRPTGTTSKPPGNLQTATPRSTTGMARSTPERTGGLIACDANTDPHKMAEFCETIDRARKFMAADVQARSAVVVAPTPQGTYEAGDLHRTALQKFSDPRGGDEGKKTEGLACEYAVRRRGDYNRNSPA